MSPRRILQIFSRYQEVGGEEGSVTRIRKSLQSLFHVEHFSSSTAELMGAEVWERLLLPWKLFHNSGVKRRLLHHQKAGRFESWLVHNVFPGLSPVVYSVAEELSIPVVQYLHNYRFGCINGMFLNHGSPCQRCISGNFFPAFQTACWHNSHVFSGGMAAVMAVLRSGETLSKIARFVALSHRQKEIHVGMGISAEKIDVIHHFLESPENPTPASGAKDVLFIGRLSPEKGGMQLLQVWKKLACSDRRLYIVGKGPQRETLEAYCHQAGLENVIFTGFLEKSEQEEIWARTAFTMVPSLWEEPFGMVVLESWAHGKPVIAYRIGALPEIIDHGINGRLCEPDNEDELASEMESFFANPRQAAECGMAGYHKLISHFHQSRWLEEIQATYARLS